MYATDLHTGITIRCKVIIDMISRIQIFHHAVKIDLDELATLHVRAFDSEGIRLVSCLSFSSLNGTVSLQMGLTFVYFE